MLLQIQDDEFLNAEGPSSSGRPRDSNDDASSSSERPNHSLDAPAEVFLLSIFKLIFHLSFPVEPSIHATGFSHFLEFIGY